MAFLLRNIIILTSFFVTLVSSNEIEDILIDSISPILNMTNFNSDKLLEKKLNKTSKLILTNLQQIHYQINENARIFKESDSNYTVLQINNTIINYTVDYSISNKNKLVYNNTNSAYVKNIF